MELTKEWVKNKLPKRPKKANKGTFGKVLIIAGSEHYPGAAYLASSACYRAGAGLVTLATENEVKIIVSRKLPEVTFINRDEVLIKVKEYDVLLAGPGLGQNKEAEKSVTELMTLNFAKTETVIDGDGLNILSRLKDWWKKITPKTILTPHPGEMSRLTNISIDEIQKNRIDVAKNYAKKWGQIVVLKGANTVIVSPFGEEVLVSPFVNPLLATAGTGDVLSGIIAGLLAQGLEPFDAAGVGVYIHGAAGEMIKKKIGDAGMLASDLLSEIPLILKELR